MAVVTITSRKGGCGKTMISTALAASLAAEGVDVALLDADPNASAHRWITTTYEGPPIAAYAEADAERLADLLPALAARHQLLICDTAGFENQAATVCIAGADAVLIPATPGEGDVIEAQRTAAYVAGLARSTRRAIPARVLANRIRRSTTLSRHALSQLEAAGLALFTSTLSEAVGYGEMGFSGALPHDGAAATEITSLIVELRSLGWLQQGDKTTTLKLVKA
jgi:chromosome partitioning protein